MYKLATITLSGNSRLLSLFSMTSWERMGLIWILPLLPPLQGRVESQRSLLMISQMITKRAVVAIVFLISEENHNKFIIFLVGSSLICTSVLASQLPNQNNHRSAKSSNLWQINVSRLLYVIVTLQNQSDIKKEVNRHRLVIGSMDSTGCDYIWYYVMKSPNFHSQWYY